MPSGSTAVSCPPNLKWQWADRGWITGDDRVKFVLGLNRGTVRGFHEQEAPALGANRRVRICGALEIVEVKPKHGKAIAPTWTGTTEAGPSSLRKLRASAFGARGEPKTSFGKSPDPEEPFFEGKRQQLQRVRRGVSPTPGASGALARRRGLARLPKSSSLPSLLPPSGEDSRQPQPRRPPNQEEEGAGLLLAGSQGVGSFLESGSLANAEPSTTTSTAPGEIPKVSFHIPPATPSLPAASVRSSEPAASERSVLKIMAAPCLMNLYDGLRDWSPKWAPQPISGVRHQRPKSPKPPVSPSLRESAEEIQERLEELKAQGRGSQQYTVPKPFRLEHQSSSRCTAFDFAGCIQGRILGNPNPKVP